ncbi:MAG: hypothetical protein H0X46_04980 [Bacteroidetes bacterium]|nr:hypothetical protein [Bacteroidota bacterium]
MKKIFATILTIAVIMLASCSNEKGEIPKKDFSPDECESVSYTLDIAPFVAANCAGCHSSSFTGYDLTTYTGVKAKADNGSFRNRVLVVKDMPGYCVISENDKKKIDCWLSNGAQNN